MYEFIIENNETYAIMPSGVKHIVQGEDQKYFHIENPFVEGKFKIFTHRIYDALRAVRDGKGDAIQRSMFGGLSVLRFIDRDYGEEVRQRVLEGFEKVTKERIKYCLIRPTETLSGMVLSYDGKSFTAFATDKEIVKYETEEDAKNAIPAIIEKLEKDIDEEFKDISEPLTDADKEYIENEKKRITKIRTMQVIV